MDFNSHMRNTAFLDKSADVRMMYFAENGFPASEFSRLRLGRYCQLALGSMTKANEAVKMAAANRVGDQIAGFAPTRSRHCVKRRRMISR